MKPHNIVTLPPGKTVRDILPAFRYVKHEIRFIFGPQKICAGCRKPFNAVRKVRAPIRLYSTTCPTPLCWSYALCAACLAMERRGGTDRDALLASIEAFHMGEEASE